MATWVTHLMIADEVMKALPELDRHGFCVGNIAPDCNVENEDWTILTPPKQVTHWMQGKRKTMSDVDPFCEQYIIARKDQIKSKEEYDFLLGYYAHLIIDASFQWFIRDPERVKKTWDRIKANEEYREKAVGYAEDWDSVKKIISKQERMSQICTIEAEYLKANPNSGFLTEIVPLKEFPDYIDYLPHGSIARKIPILGYIPKEYTYFPKYIAITREEYAGFVKNTVETVINKFKEKNLV